MYYIIGRYKIYIMIIGFIGIFIHLQGEELKKDIIFIDGKEILLIKDYKFDSRVFYQGDKQKYRLIENNEFSTMFKQLILKDGVKLYKTYVKQFRMRTNIAAEFEDKMFRLTQDSIGYFFQKIDSPEKASELVLFTHLGKIIKTKECYKKILEGCLELESNFNGQYIHDPSSAAASAGFSKLELNSPLRLVEIKDPPVTGVVAENVPERRDLYLVSFLMYEPSAESSKVKVYRYIVDSEGHITEVDSLICIRGPWGGGNNSSGCPSDLASKFYKILDSCIREEKPL